MFDQSGNQISIPLPPDEEGYTGRECPKCRSYFKIVFGTSLKGTTHCYCPHCGYKGNFSGFHTQAQIEYVQSVGANYVSAQIINMFKSLETELRSRPRQRGGLFTVDFDIKVTGQPTPIRYYWEPKLETKVTCSNCTLQYAIYGVYAFCPDCGQHNSQQILENNLDIAQKMLALAEDAEGDMVVTLIGNSLGSVVAAFDGFGRKVCRVFADKTSDPTKAAGIRFQNLTGAQTNVQQHFGFDIASPLTATEWEDANRCFQKRHLLAHNNGVIDDDYIAKANDPKAVKGRKVSITPDEIVSLIDIIRKLGAYIMAEMKKLP